MSAAAAAGAREAAPAAAENNPGELLERLKGGGDGAPEGDFVLDQLVSGLLATPCIRRRLDQHYKSELQVIKEGLPELPELPPISGGALD